MSRRGRTAAIGGLLAGVGVWATTAPWPAWRRAGTAELASPASGSSTVLDPSDGAMATSPNHQRPVEVESRTTRTMRVAAIGGRGAASYALHRARRRFASAERQAELDAEFELRTAEDVAAALGNMKGALMKLGQMASYLDTGLPEPVRVALADLQQDAPPMSGELAGEVVERELGAAPDTLFLEWDPVPIASASIGQVHRAITATNAPLRSRSSTPASTRRSAPISTTPP